MRMAFLIHNRLHAHRPVTRKSIGRLGLGPGLVHIVHVPFLINHFRRTRRIHRRRSRAAGRTATRYQERRQYHSRCHHGLFHYRPHDIPRFRAALGGRCRTLGNGSHLMSTRRGNPVEKFNDDELSGAGI